MLEVKRVMHACSNLHVQLCVTLWTVPTSLFCPCILQAKILEWVAAELMSSTSAEMSMWLEYKGVKQSWRGMK